MTRTALVAAAFVPFTMVCGQAQAATQSFMLNVGQDSTWTGTWGEVTLTEVNANEVDVHVDLFGGSKFVDTGGADSRPVDPHTAFVFNLANNTGVTISGLTSGFTPDPYVPDNQTPFGLFSNGISCCGRGASNSISSPLDFKVTRVGGISIASFAANSQGFNFSADVLSGFTGLTGNVAADPPRVPPVPEPETYALMLAGLGLMGVCAKRRRKGQ
jgi:hypothetical protein